MTDQLRWTFYPPNARVARICMRNGWEGADQRCLVLSCLVCVSGVAWMAHSFFNSTTGQPTKRPFLYDKASIC